MFILTKRFGRIEIEEKQVISFTGPILGFTESKYVVLHQKDDENPFDFLQSTENENLTFIVINPFHFFEDYEVNIDSQWLESLDIQNDKDVDILVIVTVRNAEDITCNLKAPILLNNKNQLAAQIILDHSEYSTRHPLFEKAKGEGSNADPIEE
ncbi:flagellar assembly protein FliW [Paenibacillus vortex V453]|jgi:flagellar assembly factor FliW|uniref:Flagellar assembly factor FliW n=1 Tax=Paenibacillus vortex V453 TaxID=715225 RepID=A0A2R9SLF0_9BACL|nr:MULTISPECIES: flagellar assembly protein FliW [Paenibacillus]ANA79781.1 flagellar assembly protein FliW [Paenibacillus glucanolyticus]AVV56194.1 flagellar assembly protein FliW [Paenibacillus glucanolyticus]EFU38186.1 flagellar assembly protein FliW [Paenibacillus vortex V453]ETT38986.1 flagellar assembly protein FliW [Paenibacillus sp. FSL R5-808]MPY20068.1 flagellar assembly protein FliW [Paenibacillus glucanolyticus]